jgi:chaperonin cofactor prefoldin
VLTPLVQQIKERKRSIEARLEVLRKVNDSSESLDSEIAEMDRKLQPLQKQYDELKAIIQDLQFEPEEASTAESPCGVAAAVT